jgi:hypothetical protein
MTTENTAIVGGGAWTIFSTHDEQDDAEAARDRRNNTRAAAPYHALLVLERGARKGETGG